MVRIEIPYPVFPVLDRSSVGSDPKARCEGEQREELLCSRVQTESPVPGWESLWVDLGGEG